MNNMELGNICRILDANMNRAQEGLRVCEEYVRFALENPTLSRELKDLRHRLQEAEKILKNRLANRLLQYRDTPGDIGTGISTASENSRNSLRAVVTASLKRLEEALRVLEEYSKTVSPEAAGIFETIRYKVYHIEKILLGDTQLQDKLKDAALYVLITGSLSSTDALTACREAVAGGADIIQMREKEMEDGEFYELALKMREICTGKAIFLLNDRPHIAALTGADGIHTGQGDLPVTLCKKLMGADKIVGKSTSAPEFAEMAYSDRADYIGIGPVYPTNTKQHRAAVGLEYVKWAAEHSQLPYFCIGSINRDTLHGVLDAGARAVAVCTAIINARGIADEAAWFKNEILQARAGN